jgi:hypothetical protein
VGHVGVDGGERVAVFGFPGPRGAVEEEEAGEGI